MNCSDTVINKLWAMATATNKQANEKGFCADLSNKQMLKVNQEVREERKRTGLTKKR